MREGNPPCVYYEEYHITPEGNDFDWCLRYGNMCSLVWVKEYCKEYDGCKE